MKKKENNMLPNFEMLNGKTIIVTQSKSELKYSEDQRQTLKGLGVRGIHTSSELKCDKSIYGMLNKVKHLIEVKIK